MKWPSGFEAFDYQGQPVVVLCVPAAVAQPVSFHGVEYIRIHSAKVKLASHADKEARLTTLHPDGAQTTDITDAPSWLDGPPYALVEHVFDESCFGALYASALGAASKTIRTTIGS